MNHAHYQTDRNDARWTYHIKTDTLAHYVSGNGDRHTIRLPGASSMTVRSNQIANPAAKQAGGLRRWPCLDVEQEN